MKKIGKFVLALIILVSLIGCKSKEEKMLDYMEKKYGEEFVLGFAGGRGDTLIVQTIPKRYLGTPKERDKYYRGQIFYEKNDIGDDYGAVLLKESTNEYFRPKLEELFGKNILIALDLEGQYFHTDFVKEMNRRKENRKIYGEIGAEPPLSGGIYIFGRVESEKDREKYRRGIYEFIQYLKQEGMFEYTDIEIRVLDERILSRGYNENYEDQAMIESFGDYYEREKREKIYGKYTQDFKETPQEYKNKVLDNKIKSLMNKEKSLLYIRIQSPKIAKQLNEPIIDYGKISNIRFNLGMYDDDWKFKKKEA